MSNRNRLRVLPLGTSRRLWLIEMGKLLPLPQGAVKVAEIDDSGTPNAREPGWLIRLPTGVLGVWTTSGSFQSVDQRKADAALKWLETNGQKSSDDGRE
jgi:hypothetical protein